MKRLINLMALIYAMGLLLSCNGNSKEEEQLLRPVRYYEVGYRGAVNGRTFSGTAATEKRIDLSFRNSGVVTEFEIQLGQKVTKGQLLAKLDNVQSRLAYEQAVNQETSAESQMKTAKLNLDRVRELFEKSSTSLSDLENAKNAYRTAKQNYESAKRGSSIQLEQIRFGYLYAPFDGTIAEVHAEINENVGPGQKVATLNAGEQMEIALGIPESIINKIAQNDIVKVRFSALKGEEYIGVVSEIAPSVEASTATFPVMVRLDGPHGEVKSGMAADVTFGLENGSKVATMMVVPAKAVGEDENGRFVFLIVENDSIAHVRKQHITSGKLSGEWFEIVEGLSIGQKVATAGLQTLLDGQQIDIQ
ncbi:efflux RND transporter periplasmic adaptor subunit [uncultured Croceitalea sp.]|uniref:efflux RND transporter periplasmic adaptor subunit n=1 Tax=uncultured Croceitalea sp. TaxID=1798908 RepID=UPI0033056C58